MVDKIGDRRAVAQAGRGRIKAKDGVVANTKHEIEDVWGLNNVFNITVVRGWMRRPCPWTSL